MNTSRPLRFLSYSEVRNALRPGFTCVIRLVRRNPSTGICSSFMGSSSFHWNPVPGGVTVAPDFSPHAECGKGLHAWRRRADLVMLAGIRVRARTKTHHLDSNETHRSERLLALQVPTSHLIEVESEKVKFFAAITLGFVRPLLARQIIGMNKVL